MSWSSAFGVVAYAVGLGLVVTLLTGDSRVISLEIWLASALVLALLLAGRAAIRQVPPAPGSVLPLLRRASGDEATTSRIPKDLRTLQRVVSQSIEHPRSHHVQLRPRLERLTATRGTEQLPDDVVWLLDPESARSPTLDDLDRFLDIVAPTSNPDPEGPRP